MDLKRGKPIGTNLYRPGRGGTVGIRNVEGESGGTG